MRPGASTVNEGLIGAWVATSDVIKDFVLRPDGSCQVDGTPALWQAAGDEIWLLDGKTRAGTKWKFVLEGDATLLLSAPEDFKYLGGSKYVYFQMIDPGTVINFARIDSTT
jgi:hypothetical protein